MARYRWSNGYSKAWEFEAEDHEFRQAALDALITARLESRRRGHDGRTHRNYEEYPQLQLHMAGPHISTWYCVGHAPYQLIWENIPGYIQAPAYDPDAWWAEVVKMRNWLAQLDAFVGAVSSTIGDIMRRPSEWTDQDNRRTG